MASPEYERFIQLVRNSPKMVEMPLDQQRAAGEHAEQFTAEPQGITYETVDAGGVRAVWATAEHVAEDRALLYLFGGGYVISSPHSRRKFSGHLVHAAGCRVLVPDYRLAPEHPFPAAIDDSTAAYRWLLSQGFQPQHLAVAGESSGGGLTMATLLALRGAGTPPPATAVAMSPWVDLACTGETMHSLAGVDLTCTEASLRRMAGQYLAGKDPHDPLASPLDADLAGLPSFLVQVGGAEILLDDSVRLARKAGIDGVDVTLQIWAGMQHFFQIGIGVYPEAGRAVAEIGRWLRTHLGIPLTSGAPATGP
jgi:monoterpene epsilon-lactone hydrolase